LLLPNAKSIMINDFSLKTNTHLAIIGENGGGKTTLLDYLVKSLKEKNKKIFYLPKYINEF
ncbi:MAG: ATP-binding cassette domain-containing protein, partial [Acholeplasmatales bacterium]|nr:ATP-binding cassette domain-containing protein [Acholeplasmatales bacterium]